MKNKCFYAITAVKGLAVERPANEQALLGCSGEFGRLALRAKKEYFCSLISPAVKTLMKFRVHLRKLR